VRRLIRRYVRAVAFRGWPAEAVEFFHGLEADNSKAYWQRNKTFYNDMVRGPMEELLAELAPEHGPGKIFRPYRDMRFSKDKSPYKTNIAALVGDWGYVSLSREGLSAGAGTVHMGPDQLERFRHAVDDARSGPALDALLRTIRAAGHDWAPHDPLKTAPRGYAKDHPRIEILRGRGIIMWHQWPPAAWLGTKQARARIVEVLKDSQPLKAWLGDHAGPSTDVS